jgi:hypothetical protein
MDVPFNKFLCLLMEQLISPSRLVPPETSKKRRERGMSEINNPEI